MRKKACVELLLNLQKLFAHMINSNRKYVEPTAVIKALVDDYGSPMSFGDQKDIGEFNTTFLAQIDEALSGQKLEGPAASSPGASILVQRPVTGRERDRERERERDSPSKDRTVLMRLPSLSLSASSSYERDESFIYKHFFGQFTVITKARENDGKPIELQAYSAFAQIMVSPTEKDLYEGWDTNYFSEVEDYQTPSVSGPVGM